MRQDDQLPQPPQITRGLSFEKYQLIGVPLLVLLPALALWGVFGVSWATTKAAAEGLDAEVTYPERIRYRMHRELEVTVRNTGGKPLPVVVVSFDRSYISAFSQVQFTPSARNITDEGYEVQLNDIPPGGERRVSASLQADDYGRHGGWVTVEARGGGRSRLPVTTIVFP